MVNLVRVKRKRGLPSPADRLYVDVNDGNLVADSLLLAGLSVGSAGEGTGGASPGDVRPRRAKRYRRIIGNMTLLELEAQEFRDGFEAGVDELGALQSAGDAAVDRTLTGMDETDGLNEEHTIAGGEATRDAADSSNRAKRKECSMTYAVVKRRRENSHVAALSGSQRIFGVDIDLDPLRRLGDGYRVCDLEFTPSTPDVKSRAEEEDELYDLYVEEDGDSDHDDVEHVGSGLVSSCALVYVDDCDFFMPEFDEDREESDGFDSEDSNAEDYFLNDYPDEDEGETDEEHGRDDGYLVGRIGEHGVGWSSDEQDESGGYGSGHGDGWSSDCEEY